MAGCKTVGCVYISGETPQLKTKIVPDRLDIAGAAFGILANGFKPIDSNDLRAGDRIVLVESSGPHENGFTSLREIASRLPQGYRTKMSDGKEFWEGMNAGSKLYTPLIQDILAAGIAPTNLENITGHGWQKLMRPKQNFRYRIQRALPVLPVFDLAQKGAGLTAEEMLRIFNYGAGLAVFVRTEDEARKVVELAARQSLNAVVAGTVEECSHREVVAEPFNVTLTGDEFLLKKG